jgi:hypothetical protein
VILTPPPCRSEFDRRLARTLCQASLDAYRGPEADEPIQREWDAHYTRLVTAPATDTEARIIGDDRNVVLAFRGTSSLRDARTDIKAQRRAWKYGHAHAGFLDAWRSIRSQIINTLHEFGDNGQQLYVTGHSLGGALANLCAYELELAREFSVSNLYTFGAPRVFDRAGSNHAAHVLRDCSFRVVHGNDVIPRLPRVFWKKPWLPTVHSLRHNSPLVFLTEDGHVLGDRSPVTRRRRLVESVTGFRLNFGRDHSLSQYLEGLV